MIQVIAVIECNAVAHKGDKNPMIHNEYNNLVLMGMYVLVMGKT